MVFKSEFNSTQILHKSNALTFLFERTKKNKLPLSDKNIKNVYNTRNFIDSRYTADKFTS